jgi:hypothetical protein
MKLTPPFQKTGTGTNSFHDSSGHYFFGGSMEEADALLEFLDRPDMPGEEFMQLQRDNAVRLTAMVEAVKLAQPIDAEKQAAWDARVAKADLTQERIAAALEKIAEGMPSMDHAQTKNAPYNAMHASAPPSWNTTAVSRAPRLSCCRVL